jgi:spore germination cell wall hydrolase CwlJ-like protein
LIFARLKTPLLFCAVISPLFLAGCSQTTSHGMSVSGLTDAITPSFLTSRPFGHTPKDKECLERAMFFESNRSSRDGMIAVGTVVMNRLRSGNHGATICDVVGEPGQFAPGVMTRPMNSRALPDVEEAADAVLKGERKAKLRNTMYFHTAGLRFPYKNMHYTMVAGGNAFYEKRGRNWQPLPDEPMVAFAPAQKSSPVSAVLLASAEPRRTDARTLRRVNTEQDFTTASLEPARPVKTARAAPAQPVFMAAAVPAKSGRLPVRQTMVAMQEPMAEPDAARFGDLSSKRVIRSVENAPQEASLGFQSTPEDTDSIGAMIVSQGQPLEAN